MKHTNEDNVLIFNPDTIWKKNYFNEIIEMENMYFSKKLKNILLLVKKELSFDKNLNGDFDLKENLIIKPKLYWKRNQDMYVYLRHNPAVYRNLHISNKVGFEVNGSYKSELGSTGFGLDVSSVKLSSNNLGNRNRTMVNLFLEQQVKFADEKIDLTPGVAFSYFSDVSTNMNYKNNFFRNNIIKIKKAH